MNYEQTVRPCLAASFAASSASGPSLSTPPPRPERTPLAVLARRMTTPGAGRSGLGVGVGRSGVMGRSHAGEDGSDPRRFLCDGGVSDRPGFFADGGVRGRNISFS